MRSRRNVQDEESAIRTAEGTEASALHVDLDFTERPHGRYVGDLPDDLTLGLSVDSLRSHDG